LHIISEKIKTIIMDGNLKTSKHTREEIHSTPPNSTKDDELQVSYSTISPKVGGSSGESSSNHYPMHIKLSLIDQNPPGSNIADANGGSSSCESPFPMTPVTPGNGSGDVSKKQRHNLREQRRILRISNQFDILRKKLESAGYSPSKKDKYSVLQATLEYITYLERNQRPGAGVSAPSNPQNSFMIDSMPSPVPALSVSSMHQFPMELENQMYHSHDDAERVESSSATYRDVFSGSSMPSIVAKLDGTIVEANGLFLELCCKNIDELRLHSLYTMCTAVDAPKMYSLVNKILACETASAQSKMMWHFTNSGDRKVFVSVSMVHDNMHRPANLHCSLLPLS
jgi:PAS domain-containing protein